MVFANAKNCKQARLTYSDLLASSLETSKWLNWYKKRKIFGYHF